MNFLSVKSLTMTMSLLHFMHYLYNNFFCVASYSYLILDFLKKSKIFANIMKTSAQRVSFRPQIRVLIKFDICDQ